MTDIVERLHVGAERMACLPIDPGEVGLTVMIGVELMREAAVTIESLRSLGIAAVGPGFAEITKDVPRRSTEPADPK